MGRERHYNVTVPVTIVTYYGESRKGCQKCHNAKKTNKQLTKKCNGPKRRLHLTIYN